MSMRRREALLDWARQARSWIIEDDYDSEFRYRHRPLPCLNALDADGRVIYVGSFSKTLFPSLRLGFVVLPPDLRERVATARRSLDLQPPARPGAAPPPGTPLQWDSTPNPDDAGWAQGAPKPPPAPEPAAVPVPNPRRPVWVTGEPDGPWAAPAQPATQRPVAPASPNQRGGSAVTTDPAAAAADFVRLIARGAGLPDDAFAAQDPAQFAAEVGQLLRLTAENMKQLLEARQQAKRFARSTNQTTVQALDNNPLKFAPTVEEAMRIMFGARTKSYLGASSAVAQGFDDLKTHQIKTFSAMQHALKRLMEEFDPAAIERASTGDRGLLGALGSSKARSWDTYAARWQARTRSHEDGMLDAFMQYFAEYYDRDGNKI